MDPAENRKIALFIATLGGGGAERVMVTLANYFSSHGSRVDLVLAEAKGSYLKEINSKVNIVDLRSKLKILAIWHLYRYLRANKPQALLSTLNGGNVIASLANMLAGRKTRLILREANTPSLEKKNLGIKTRTLMKIAKAVYPYAHHIVGVSKGVTEDLIRTHGLAGKVRCETVYSPVITPELLEKSGLPLQKELPWKDEFPIILGAGRLCEQKDFSTLIKAFHKLRKKKKCHLVILGEGPLRSRLTAEISSLGVGDDVWMPGFVDNPFPFMRIAAVYVLSSLWEGLPNTLIQAMVCGAPVVATDCPSGPREILLGGKWGELVAMKDSDALCNAICLQLSRRSNHVFNESLKSYIFDNFGVESACSRYRAIICGKHVSPSDTGGHSVVGEVKEPGRIWNPTTNITRS